ARGRDRSPGGTTPRATCSATASRGRSRRARPVTSCTTTPPTRSESERLRYHAPVARSGFSHVIGVDDAPFAREHRGRVLVVARAYAGLRLEGVLSTHVRRDGADATRALAERFGGSRFAAHTRLVMLQGIALAGFNVVDIHGLHEALG